MSCQLFIPPSLHPSGLSSLQLFIPSSLQLFIPPSLHQKPTGSSQSAGSSSWPRPLKGLSAVNVHSTTEEEENLLHLCFPVSSAACGGPGPPAGTIRRVLMGVCLSVCLQLLRDGRRGRLAARTWARESECDQMRRRTLGELLQLHQAAAELLSRAPRCPSPWKRVRPLKEQSAGGGGARQVSTGPE